MTPELTMLWTHTDRLGYGRMGVKLAAALRAQGIDIFECQGAPGEIVGDRDPRHQRTNVLCTISYPSHLRGWWDGQTRVAFTMFESTELPEAFRETLHQYQLVLVPSVQNVELFSRFHANVRLCLLGVDPAEWAYVERTPPARDFVFLIAGGGPRKGVDLAAEAFRRAFSSWPHDGPIPKLVVKSPKPQDVFGERVEQRNGFLSPADERALYASAHCYLQPSRGEGFGLQPLQAIAQGLPTILTDAHGHEAFARLGLGVPADLVKIPYGYFSIGDAGDWWEPRIDDLVDRMRYVYTNYEAACGAAQASAVEAGVLFSWERTADRFVDCVDVDAMTRPYGGGGTWEASTPRRYPTRVLRSHQAETHDGQRFWQPGVDYWETADIKRILLDSGVLDPACADAAEPGMDAGLVERYSSLHEYCPTCGVKANSGVTRADEIEAELASR